MTAAAHVLTWDSMCCAALLLDTVLALLHDSISGTPEVLRAAQNAIAVGGAAGFGVSLYLIHIYVTPIKRFLQLLWGTGVLGGLALMSTQVRILHRFLPLLICMDEHRTWSWPEGLS